MLSLGYRAIEFRENVAFFTTNSYVFNISHRNRRVT